MTGQTQSAGEIGDIEVLRAIAVIGVVFQHIRMLFPRGSLGAEWPILFSGGWVGVDLFFAISGFVIARSFMPKAVNAVGLKEHRALAFSFWVKRLYRLTPSAWFWLLMILLLSALYNESGVFASFKVNLLWTLAGTLNFSNYLLVQTFGSEQPGASFVYWSLSLEEQFYLVFPVAVLLFRRHLFSVLLVIVLVQLPFQRGEYGMLFRTDAISLGVMLALLSRKYDLGRLHAFLGNTVCRILLLVAVAALFWLGISRQTDFKWQVGAVAVVSALAVFLASANRNLLSGTRVIGIPLVWLGRRSYAMYLVHIPVIFTLYETAYRLNIPLVEFKIAAIAVALFLIVVISGINYRWLETPLRERGRGVAERVYERFSGAGRRPDERD